MARLAGIVVGLLLIVLAVFPWLWAEFGGGTGSRTFAQLWPGDCIKLSELDPTSSKPPGTSVELVHEEVPCDAPGAMTYTVAEVAEGPLACLNGNYLDYFTTGVGNPGNLPREYTACLVPNFAPGTCVAIDPMTQGYVALPCADGVVFRVDAVHDADDPALCGGHSRPMEFPLPQRTYCVSEVR